MQAVIYAGGKGTRMQKLFPGIQKCMIPIAGKPVIQYQIEWLRENGITNILIYVCHKAEQIKDYFKDGREFSVRIRYAEQKKLMGTGHHLRFMEHNIHSVSGDIILLYGDQVVKDVNFKMLERKHYENEAFITFIVHDDKHPQDSDRIAIDSSHKVTGFGDVEGLTNTAIFIAKKRILEYIPEEDSDLTKDIIPELIKEEECYAYDAGGYIKDIGTPERYEQCLKDMNGDYKVAFVYPNMFAPFAFSPAIQTLSAMLKQKKINTGLVHINNESGVKDDDKIIIQYLKSLSPKLIAFTATSFEFERVKKIAKAVKREFKDIPLILGGPHATICPQDIEDTVFDAFCIGEGDGPFVDFVLKHKNGLSTDEVKSFWIRKGDRLIKNPLAPFIKDLDDLPFLDLGIMDTRRLLNARKGWFSLSFSRGCPFECTYCINHLYKKINCKGTSVKDYCRKMTVNKVIKQLELIAREYKELKVFNLDDDLIMLYSSWIKHFCEEYKRRIYDIYNINFIINARVNTLIGHVPVGCRIPENLKSAGCSEVRIGVETGNYSLRKNILNKDINNEDIMKAFDKCHAVGLKPYAFVMVGIPGETKATIYDTLVLMARIKPYMIRLSILYPYKHTKIYDYCIKHKLFRKGHHLNDLFSDTALKFKNLTRADIIRYRLLFPWYLNTILYTDSVYHKLIKKYEKYSAERLLQSNEAVRKEDASADSRCRKPHFRFLNRNTYYVEYVEK